MNSQLENRSAEIKTLKIRELVLAGLLSLSWSKSAIPPGHFTLFQVAIGAAFSGLLCAEEATAAEPVDTEMTGMTEPRQRRATSTIVPISGRAESSAHHMAGGLRFGTVENDNDDGAPACGRR